MQESCCPNTPWHRLLSLKIREENPLYLKRREAPFLLENDYADLSLDAPPGLTLLAFEECSRTLIYAPHLCGHPSQTNAERCNPFSTKRHKEAQRAQLYLSRPATSWSTSPQSKDSTAIPVTIGTTRDCVSGSRLVRSLFQKQASTRSQQHY